MTDIDFGAMNIDNQPNTPTRFGRQSLLSLKGGTSLQKNGIRGIPTCILVVNGEVKSQKVGMTTKSDFENWLKENI